MAQTRKFASYNKKSLGPITWHEAVKRFLAYLNGPAEASRYTYDHYRRDLERFERWWDDHRKDQLLEPASILGSDLLAWKEHLRAELIDPDTKRKRKAAAVNTLMAAVKSFLRWANEAGIIAELPPMPKRVKSVRPGYKAVPSHDQNRLLRAIEVKRVKRDLALVLVLLDGGLRVAELCSLKWGDVVLSARKAELFIWQGKGDKQRDVPLSNRARKALLELRVDKRPDDPVFPSRKGATEGKPMTPRAVQLMLDKYAKPLGLSISPHQFRHSCAKDMINRGVPVPTVQAILGHGSVTTTLGYSTPSPSDKRRAVERDGDQDHDE